MDKLDKKDLMKQYKEEGESSIKYYQDVAIRKQEKMEVGVELLTMILPLSVEIKDHSTWTDIIRLEFDSVEVARKALSEILSKTTIERFIKTSRDAGSQLKWDYTVDYKGVMLSIGPAEPAKDCVAVKKVNTYTSWVCEQGGK